MEVMKSPKIIALGAGVASFAAILGGGVLAHAQGASASNDTAVLSSLSQTSPSSGTQATPPTAADRQAQMDAYLSRLAANLGIDVSKLKDALKTTSLAQIDQAVADGKMTQAQADQAKAAVENGQYFGFGGRGGPGGPGGPGAERRGRGGMADQTALASFLGTDAATLRTELQGGKSLATVASDHGKSRDDLKAFLTAQENTEVATAVTNGNLTQAQADAHLQQFTANLDKMIDGTGGPRGMGPGGHGGPRQGNGTNGTTTAPTTQG